MEAGGGRVGDRYRLAEHHAMLVISSRGHPMGMPHRPPGRKGRASLR
jgi:hypothetical protein